MAGNDHEHTRRVALFVVVGAGLVISVLALLASRPTMPTWTELTVGVFLTVLGVWLLIGTSRG
jgi:uncharacterized protein (DUF983 family)